MAHLRMVSGDIVTHSLRVVDSAGAAIDISLYTPISISVFATNNGEPTGAALFTDTLAGDIAFTTDGSDGLLDVPWAAADTAALAGVYYVEVQLTDAGGLVRTASFLIQIDADKITA